MGARRKPVVASILSGDALATSVLARYPLARPLRCQFFALGLNDTYRVAAGSERYFLRVYTRGWRAKREIEAELELLDRLARRGQPVSRPLPRRDGRLLTRVAAPEGPRHAALFSDAPGKPPDFGKVKNARRYGELVARLHAAADRERFDARRFHLDRSHLVDEPLAALEPVFAHRPADVDYLRRVGAELGQAIDALRLPRRAPQYGFCHGDHHGGNVHEDADGNLVVFDFDCYGHGYRAYDLAVFLWSGALRPEPGARGKARLTRRWNAFLDGYESVRALTDAEREATRLFVPVRTLWLVGLHSRMSARVGRAQFGDAYFDRILGFVRGYIRAHKLL